MAFVGRERELVQLAGALQRASGGKTTRVVIAGPAGVGSTRLLDELANRVRALPGVIVARGAADPPSSGIAYRPLSDALGSALAQVPDDRLGEIVGSAGHDLSTLIPGLHARLERLDIDHLPPHLEAREQRGARVVEGVLETLVRLAGDGVVLLALEDLHWADPATRGFVASLLRISRPLPLCVVVTYQPEELHRHHPARDLIVSFQDDVDIEWLTLEPLGAQDLRRLVEDLLGEPASGGLMAAVMEGSRGVPLLATQLALASTSLEGLRLSDPFDQVLSARLDAVSPEAARTIRIAAAARRPLPRADLLRLRVRDGRTTAAALEEALECRLLVEDERGVAIAHELYAEAIEELQLAPERHQLHIALAGLAATSPAVAAWHWAAAARADEARAAHLQAAIQSEDVDPGETALFHYQRALELGMDERRADDGELADILSRAAHAASNAGAFRRAAALMRRAIEKRVGRRAGAERKGRDMAMRCDLGIMQAQLGRYLWSGGDLVAGIAEMEQALALIPAEPSVARARTLAWLAQHLMMAGRFDESVAASQEARTVARATGDAARPELGHATCTLGVDIAYLGELDRGLALLEEATVIAREEGRLDDLMRAHANRTTLLDLDSRREQALAVVTDGISDAQAGGLGWTYGAFLRGNAADCLFQLGRWADAEAECRAAMEWPPSGVAWFSPTLYLGLVLVESRADDEAARLIGQTLLQLETVPAGQWTALVLRAAVSLALWRGDVADAMAVAEREWERVLETDDPLQVAVAASTTLEAAAAASEEGRMRRMWPLVAAAGQLAQQVLPEAERRVAASSLPRTLGARREAELHLATARAHEARLRGHADPSVWRGLARAWAALPIPYLAAKARWWESLAALHAGSDRSLARDALVDAWQISQGLPALPLQRALGDLAHRARIPLPDAAVPVRRMVSVGPGGREQPESEEPVSATGLAIGQQLLARIGPSAPPSFGLSPREQEVLGVLVEGRTNREIAERLFISERTVAVHMRKILAKLHVSGRTEAAGLAIRLGLVPMASPEALLASATAQR